MNGLWKELAITAVMALAVPWLILGLAPKTQKLDIAPQETQSVPQTTEWPELADPQRYVDVLIDGELSVMELDTYLTGVLLCELPGSFHQEAKKAQAVVARTYTMKVIATTAKHNGAICDQPSCCQGYTDPDAYLEAGGSEDNVRSAMLAVRQTNEEVLTYGGSLIEATYFSCSGGRTEAAVAVWGSDIPYLQAVDSPGEEIATHYSDSITFTAAEFKKRMGVTLSGSPSGWFGETTYTDGGSVKTMCIGGVRYKGTTMRTRLGLRSTAFTLTAIGDSIIITTKGFGHRVGMSQYGAQAMALEGSGYKEILSHYYQKVMLEKLG